MLKVVSDIRFKPGVNQTIFVNYVRRNFDKIKQFPKIKGELPIVKISDLSPRYILFLLLISNMLSEVMKNVLLSKLNRLGIPHFSQRP